ncbi:MAG: hypothetical protein ACTHM5_16825 [Ginsengibacter sp.]
MHTIEYIGLSIIVFFLLLALSISWVKRANRRKLNRKLQREFDDFVVENDLTIDNKQRFNRNIIGIDRLNYVVVFFNNKSKDIQSVRLKDLDECRLVKEKSGPGGHIHQIYLKCNYKQKERGAVIFPFYNAYDDDLFKMIAISKKANNWAKRINIFREAALLKNQQRLTA